MKSSKLDAFVVIVTIFLAVLTVFLVPTGASGEIVSIGSVSDVAPGSTITIPISNNYSWEFTTAEEVAPPADKWAVLIGIADYPGTVNDLDSPDNDVADMYDVLTERSGFAPDHILLLLDESATKANIADAIETWLANNEAADDTVVIYYSGHGIYDTDDNGDEDDGYDEFLCPYDTTADNTTMIRDDEFDTMLDALDSEKAVIILDSCFSGGMTKAIMPTMASLSEGLMTEPVELTVRTLANTPKAPLSDGFKKDIAQTGRVVLMATDDDEPGWEGGVPIENGIFTYYLVEGLNSAYADTNANGSIAAEEAFAYADPRVVAFVDGIYDEPQHPQIDDQVAGDFDLSEAPTAPVWTELLTDPIEGVDPDIAGVDYYLTTTEVSFRVRNDDVLDLWHDGSVTFLDVDQDSGTGYFEPSTDLIDEPTNDIGADYWIDMGWGFPYMAFVSEWNESEEDWEGIAVVPTMFDAETCIFTIPLAVLNDDGTMDVVQLVGKWTGFDWYYTDIAPDTGHGTIPEDVDTTPPASISNLQNETGETWINWTWDNPPDADFDYVMVYVDGAWETNTSEQYYNATALAPDTAYELGTHTVDNVGNINETWVNQTTKTTAAGADTTPPASISNLQNETGETWINWTWDNPPDADFDYVMVYVDGAWETNTSEQFYNATALAPDTAYELGTHTVDNVGNINETWVNQTTKTTAAGADTTPPETAITAGPSGTITYNDVQFDWSGTDDITETSNLVYQYKLDGSWSDWTSSTSKTYTDLANGDYTFMVRARDEAENEDLTPATRSLTVSVTIRRSSGGGGGGGTSLDSDGDGYFDTIELIMGTDPKDPNDYPNKEAATPTPTPVQRTTTVSTITTPPPTVTPTVPSPLATPTPEPATPTPEEPGFEVVFAVAGLLTIAYAVLRRRG